MTRIRGGLTPALALPAALAAALVVALVAAGPAAAHSEVEAVRPAPDATLAAAPARVVVTYGGTLSSVSSAEALVGGRDVAGAPRIDPADARRLVIPLRDGGAGAYRVSWVVVGADGHALSGQTAFRVRAPSPLAVVRRVGARAVAAATTLDDAVSALREG